MSLELRRKAKAATAQVEATTETATENTAAAAAEAAPATRKRREKKENAVSGSMRTIANGRRYKNEHVASLDESGMPKVKSLFDPAGRAASSIDFSTIDKERILPISDLIEHLNQELFRPLFGQPLRAQVARDLVLGFADVLTTISENKVTYRIPNGFTAEPFFREEYVGHNPKTRQPTKVAARRGVKIKPTRAVIDYLASGE